MESYETFLEEAYRFLNCRVFSTRKEIINAFIAWYEQHTKEMVEDEDFGFIEKVVDDYILDNDLELEQEQELF